MIFQGICGATCFSPSSLAAMHSGICLLVTSLCGGWFILFVDSAQPTPVNMFCRHLRIFVVRACKYSSPTFVNMFAHSASRFTIFATHASQYLLGLFRLQLFATSGVHIKDGGLSGTSPGVEFCCRYEWF